MSWIQKYNVERTDSRVIISGDFAASAGHFEIYQEGDGGNADTTTITLSGGQYDVAIGEPLIITITGAWEIREVIDMFKLLDNN